MHDQNPDASLGEMFARLADSLRPGYDVVDTLDLLVDAATKFTPAVEAGVLLVDESGGLHVAASTAERASDVEESQMGVDGGPCVDAIAAGTVVEVTDIGAEGWRWPEFATTAQVRGFRAGLAIPLTLRTQTLGGLNLFSPDVGPMSDSGFAIASALAQVATIAIVQHRSISETGELNEQLQRALDSRVVIEQAKGVISHQRGVAIDDAFAILRRHARSRQAGLSDVAAQIVDRHLVLE